MLKPAVLALGLGLLGATAAQAQVNAADVKWGPAPPVFPQGARMAVMAGDPGKAGLFIIRLKMPADYKVPAHHHPTDENVTVISGAFSLGMGDTLDMKKAATLTAGGFAQAPAGMNHYGFTAKGAVVEVAAQGPFAMTYVNPADDPTHK
ncbi:MAG: cupin domain-containing protein [Caulobacteraceae bacterium]|nr:cupin domain-containing protein [Caulobacteraceae bacterium]